VRAPTTINSAARDEKADLSREIIGAAVERKAEVRAKGNFQLTRLHTFAG
jgi:hypothetical protein